MVNLLRDKRQEISNYKLDVRKESQSRDFPDWNTLYSDQNVEIEK
jgi:hypothetical protein